MSYREALSQRSIAISISDSPDMLALGISAAHLDDAMTEIARHLLALGARLVYGGDLRANGFSELLFELVVRHRRDADEGDRRPAVTNYLAWPVHASMPKEVLLEVSKDLEGLADLSCLDLLGAPIPLNDRLNFEVRTANANEWERGLTAMRSTMLTNSDARIVLGGRTEGYKGIMPGVAEEVAMSLSQGRPVFLLAGFGGCAKDIAEGLGLLKPPRALREWQGRSQFGGFGIKSLNNGLSEVENRVLAGTPHVDQAVTLILRGLIRLYGNQPTSRALKRNP